MFSFFPLNIRRTDTFDLASFKKEELVTHTRTVVAYILKFRSCMDRIGNDGIFFGGGRHKIVFH